MTDRSPGPDADRIQTRQEELERRLAILDGDASMGDFLLSPEENRERIAIRAELARLHNEQPKGGDECAANIGVSDGITPVNADGSILNQTGNESQNDARNVHRPPSGWDYAMMLARLVHRIEKGLPIEGTLDQARGLIARGSNMFFSPLRDAPSPTPSPPGEPMDGATIARGRKPTDAKNAPLSNELPKGTVVCLNCHGAGHESDTGYYCKSCYGSGLISPAPSPGAHIQRNEQPKGGGAALNWKLSDETKERLAEIDENIAMARIRARGFVTGSAPSPAPSPEPRDVREALEKIKSLAEEYDSYSTGDLCLYTTDKNCRGPFGQIASLARDALAQSDAQPVGWQYRGVHRTPNHEAVSSWISCTQEEAEFRKREFPDTCELRPLYTASHSLDASGLIEAAEIAEQIEKSCLINAEIHRPPYKGANPEVADAHENGAAIAHQIAEAIRARAADRSAPRSDRGGA